MGLLFLTFIHLLALMKNGSWKYVHQKHCQYLPAHQRLHISAAVNFAIKTSLWPPQKASSKEARPRRTSGSTTCTPTSLLTSQYFQEQPHAPVGLHCFMDLRDNGLVHPKEMPECSMCSQTTQNSHSFLVLAFWCFNLVTAYTEFLQTAKKSTRPIV